MTFLKSNNILNYLIMLEIKQEILLEHLIIFLSKRQTLNHQEDLFLISVIITITTTLIKELLLEVQITLKLMKVKSTIITPKIHK